jgi:alpha/beta hydrolase family protein
VRERNSGKTKVERYTVSGSHAPIPHFERDRVVFSDSDWPTKAASTRLGDAAWQIDSDQHVFRRLRVCDEDAPEDTEGHHLWEVMLRFPNAPIYGTHSPREHLYEFDTEWPNYHTMRVLGSGDSPPGQVRHVYLLHNGLNETADLLFHYRLAAWILAGRTDAVCILRPLPGHLTRYPFDGRFAELPLDGYLRDPADLFRQFLRYMVETQWLLSVLVPRPFYAVSGGTRLPGAARPQGRRPVGRSSARQLAKRIGKEWRAVFERSSRIRAKGSFSEITIRDSELKLVIDELRNLLGWTPVLSKAPSPPPDDPAGQTDEPPSVHVVGYSMGGFMAQAVFFSWPYAVSSCTNLFAGGALRDLAPTAFAHPEEWQAVLHGLRYELDRALVGGFLGSEEGRVAGIDANDFEYLKRVFYEVFLQYYRGGYSSRVTEFSGRLLFVVGGSDPIVRTQKVLDAGPPEGMTLLQLAGVSHFQSPKAGASRERAAIEKEQRKLWLPEVGGMIARFSQRSSRSLQTTLAECWQDAPGARRITRRGGEYAELDGAPDGEGVALDSAGFERELDRLVSLVDTDPPGCLLISRNELPPVFLGERGFVSHASALHHSEELITRYTVALRRRAKRLRDRADRISLLIPQQTGEWFSKPGEHFALFSKSETPGGARAPSEADLNAMWRHFQNTWGQSAAVGLVKAGEYSGEQLRGIGERVARRYGLEAVPLTILPDVWIGLSHDLCKELRGQADEDLPYVLDGLVNLAGRLAKNVADAQKTLVHSLKEDSLRVVKVSAAELNPRYRGQRLTDPHEVSRALIHWALSYRASTPLKGAVTASARADSAPAKGQ